MEVSAGGGVAPLLPDDVVTVRLLEEKARSLEKL
jgi:hypothetical protein